MILQINYVGVYVDVDASTSYFAFAFPGKWLFVVNLRMASQ